jgi:transcription termination factor NusB
MNTYFSPRKIIIAMLILTAIILSQILNLSEHTLNAQQSPQDELKVLWVKYGGEGDAYATCVIGSLVYVIGKYIGPPRGAIEARNINTGELVNSWENVYGSDTELYDCVVLGGYLYVIGIDNAPGNFEWLILKFTPKLELISEKHYNPSVMDDQALFINSDGRYLYVGGIDLAGGKNDAQWHLIKVDPRDLSIIKKYTYNPSTGWDEINSMAINPLDGKIWLVCVVNAYSLSERYWRIEVLDQDLSLVASKDIKDPLRKIVFDDVGYAYITSLNKIIKVSPDLHTMVNITFYHIPYKEVYSNGYFYFAINPADSTFGPFKHVLVRTTKNFDAEVKLTLSPEDNRDYYFTEKGKMVIADNRLFVAGVVADHGRKNWIIYSIALGPIQTYPTPTYTTTTTTTITTTTVTMPTPTTTPLCFIESISISNTGTVIINGVTYPVFDVVIKASKGCGDNIKVVKVIPEKDPYDKQPALSCDLTSKTSRNGISERTYRCTAKWNYLAPPDWVDFAIKTILTSIPTWPALSISEKIAWVIVKLGLAASTLGKPVVLYNATFGLQLDSSNIVELIAQAPKSKIDAIDRYLYLKTLSKYILYITPVITGACLAGIITAKACVIIGVAMWGIGTLAPFVLQKFAYDPYSEDYTSIFEIPPPPDKIKELANVYGDIIYDLYYYVNYINASRISIERAFTAYEKGDHQWYNKQLSKALEYAEKSLMHFDKIKAFLNNELAKIEPHINKEMFENGLNYIEKNGLQKEATEILKELGIFKHVNVTEVVDIAKTLGYSEIKPREVIDVMVNTGEDVKNYVKILEKEIPTTTPVQPSPTITTPTRSPATLLTSPSATLPNLELIIITIVIVAILASLVIVFRKYKTK